MGLADHVAATVAAAGLIPLVVTADDQVADWATRTGFPSVGDPGEGLDAAARTGVEWAATAGSSWIVIHSDLPLLHSSDLSVLTARLQDGPVIAPSTDGGTSAIGMSGTWDFSFGESSFHRHLTRLSSPTVVTRTGLLLDVDSPADLNAAVAHPRGAWMRELIGGAATTFPRQILY